MTFTLSPEFLISLLGQAVLLGVAWGIMRGNFLTLRREVDELQAHQESASHTAELVTRLDERLRGVIEELKRQPQVMALCVGEAVKAALQARRPAL